MSAAVDLRINPAARLGVERVGLEGEPVLVVEDLLLRPETLVDYAAEHAAFVPEAGEVNFYPGVRAPTPPGYAVAVGRALAPALEQVFDVRVGEATSLLALLSLVTLPPDRLAPAQRLPHVDTFDPRAVAMVHYLCDERFGGTAFYRHRSTGFETLTPERAPRHRAALDAELATTTPATGYVLGDTPLYERIGGVDARFNRAVVYRSRLFHSGQIDPAVGLSADPRQGRLTANLFLAS